MGTDNFFGPPTGDQIAFEVVMILVALLLACAFVRAVWRIGKRNRQKGEHIAGQGPTDGGNAGNPIDGGRRSRKDTARNHNGLRADQAVDQEMQRREVLRSKHGPDDGDLTDQLSESV